MATEVRCTYLSLIININSILNMGRYLLQNSKEEYLKTLDTAEGKIEFTKEPSEARNYSSRPGGGQWDADNEKQYLVFHFGEEYGERVTSLHCVYRE
jgi:hypothetical protein